jgi:hypothetical protein
MMRLFYFLLRRIRPPRVKRNNVAGSGGKREENIEQKIFCWEAATSDIIRI